VQPDTSQYPLLEDVSEVLRGESAVAKRDVRLPAELDEELRTLSASLELEFLGEVGSLVYPDRVLVGMRDVRWFLRASDTSAAARLVGRARREADGEVTIFLSLEPVVAGAAPGTEEVTEEPIPVCRATLQFAHIYKPAPWPQQQQMLAPRSENLQNGKQLYASVGGHAERAPESLQVVAWARMNELGRIQGGIAQPRQLTKLLPASRIQVAPAALEGALHLVKWLWYAFSGEGAREMTISELVWYRMPRRDERLLGEARLCGASVGLATFDAHVLGQDGIPVLELRGVGMASLPTEDPAPPVPRLAWQSFVKSLTPR
jgi:hypothetical protein